MNVIQSKRVQLRTKRIFLKLGTCSQTFFYILNREFGYPMEDEEHAVDLLAGGILQQGYQCGMLWGASMALGAESFRRCGDHCQAIGVTINATQHVMGSFINRAKSADCLDITECDFSNKWSISKYFFSGRFYNCFKLAERWAPEAILAAKEGLSLDQTGLPECPASCASEVIKKMGGTDAEMVMVAGFAGGLGLSGNGCGALSAAIWMNTLSRIRERTYKFSSSDPVGEKILLAFYKHTEYEMECHKITGTRFKSIDEHTKFLKKGGCEKLIQILADTISFR